MKINRAVRFSRASFFAASLGLLLSTTLAQQPQPAQAVSTLSALQERLTAHISQPRFASATWGVKVVSLKTDEVLFEHNANKYFSPASNSKLYTVALALERLGADYRIKTSLYAKTRPNKWGSLKSDLVVYGRGDPTINARLHDGDLYKALEPFVAELRRAGVKRIKGDLIGDESFFRGPPFGSGWDWEDLQNYYGAEISALTINDNVLQLSIKPGASNGLPCRLTVSPATSFLIISNRTATVPAKEKRNIRLYRPLGENVLYVSGQMPLDDSAYAEGATIHNPALLFVSFLKDALARQGVAVSGKVRTFNWKDREVSPEDFRTWVDLGSVNSLPLRDIAREVQKPSQNLYTDLLLAHVGELSRKNDAGARNLTCEEVGIRALNTFLVEAGVPKSNVIFEEGSGLSRNNLVTPNATVALLCFMDHHQWAEVYRQALPVAGVDGTLRTRMKGTAAAGNVQAKTGTLRWANSLSGYVTTAAGERLIFAIMLNRYYNIDPSRTTRADLDAIAVMLAEFAGHSGKNE